MSQLEFLLIAFGVGTTCVLLCCGVRAEESAPAPAPDLDVHMDEPVVAALSAPGEKR